MWRARPDVGWLEASFGGAEGIYSSSNLIMSSGAEGIYSASNLIMPSGKLDPWSAFYDLVLDKTKLPVSVHWLTMPQGAHHLDLRGDNENDPKQVRETRQTEMDIIWGWIQDFVDNDLNSSVFGWEGRFWVLSGSGVDLAQLNTYQKRPTFLLRQLQQLNDTDWKLINYSSAYQRCESLTGQRLQNPFSVASLPPSFLYAPDLATRLALQPLFVGVGKGPPQCTCQRWRPLQPAAAHFSSRLSDMPGIAGQVVAMSAKCAPASSRSSACISLIRFCLRFLDNIDLVLDATLSGKKRNRARREAKSLPTTRFFLDLLRSRLLHVDAKVNEVDGFLCRFSQQTRLDERGCMTEPAPISQDYVARTKILLNGLVISALDKNPNSLWVECPVLTYGRMEKEIVQAPCFTTCDRKPEDLLDEYFQLYISKNLKQFGKLTRN
eukprot:g19869.t1